MTAEDNTVKSFYSNVYKTINYANGVISYAGDDTQIGQEARFLRNYGYYLLTQHFGGVPYITEYINSAETNYPRTELSEVYTNIIEDLTDLYNNSTLPAQNHEGRASKQAVAALLAKIYLSAGWDLDTSLSNATSGSYTVNNTARFTEAASWAEKAINGVSLTMSFEDKWSAANEGNAEEIFSVQYDRAGYPGDNSDAGHSMQNCFGGYYGACTTSYQKNVSSEDAQSEKSMYLFEEGDLRYEATYMTNIYNGIADKWGTSGYYAFYNCSADELSKLGIAMRYYPYWTDEATIEAELAERAGVDTLVSANGYITKTIHAALLTLPSVVVWTYNTTTNKYTRTEQNIATYNNQTDNGVCVRKFDDPNSAQLTGSNDYRDIVIFHVSDMYLMAAEAYLMAGQTAQALTKVNAVRNRAGLGNLGSFSDYDPMYSTSSSFTISPLDVILDERARELYAEGHRWMDLRRTKQLVRYNVEFSEYISNESAMANNSGEIKWYRPIPANEISANTGMTNEDQNPGY